LVHGVLLKSLSTSSTKMITWRQWVMLLLVQSMMLM